MAVTYALIAAGDSFLRADVLVSAVIGVAAGIAFVVRERRSADPMLPPRLFADRQFTGANIATFVIYGALGGFCFFLVLQLQNVLGYGATAAGAAMLPTSLLLTLFSARAAALAQRIGPRIPMTVGPLIVSAGTLWLLGVDGSSSYWVEVLPGSLLQGARHDAHRRAAHRHRAGRRAQRAGRHRQRGQQRRRAGRLAARGRGAAGRRRALRRRLRPCPRRSPAVSAWR